MSDQKKSSTGRRPRKTKPTVLLGLLGQVPEGILKGVMAAANDYDWNLLNLAFSNGQIPPYVDAQGAIVQFHPGVPDMEDLQQYGCKAVRLARLPHPSDHLLPAILPDYDAAGRMAASHLNERGFKNLGFLAYENNKVSQKIMEGFQRRTTELGLKSYNLTMSKMGRGGKRQDYERTEVQKWLMDKPKPFGVAVYSDHRAGHVCAACLDAGLSVPEDVAIIGYGNIPSFCDTAAVNVSSVDPNDELMGRESARVLQEMMNGSSPPKTPVLIPPKGVEQRQSTNVLAVPSPPVAKALRYIWEHFREQLSANDVAREIAVSRSGLDRLFRQYLNRTVNAEIARKRLERCAELLRSTDLSVSEIAEFTGFRTRTYLHKLFRESYGMSPRQYRLRLK